MSAFSMIESFFFLSLGIAFVLIILLVYHFKQRITTIEQKSDTMFDIVQNLAKELNSMKAARPIYANAVLQERCALEEDEEEESEEDEDDDEESESEEDEDENDDESEEDEDSADEDETEAGEARVRGVATPVPVYDNDERGEARVRGVAKESVKIINISDLEQIDDIQDLDLDSESESEEPVELIDDESDKIKVLKMTANIETDPIIVANPSNNIHVYKKMTVGSLKTLVISQGLCSDASKLSKRELLLLLTSK